MKKTVLAVLTLLLISGCVNKKPLMGKDGGAFIDRGMNNLAQLTFDGDNGEAYFSWDGKKLIFQSSRGGYACDKIWIMNSDGNDKRMVSPDHGAHTCSFFFPDGGIVFASTSHLPGDCPPKPKTPQGARYVWPLYPYNIFTADADGSHLKKITDNPKYDAEPVVSPDGKQIVFGSQREGDFDIYIMNADGANVRRLTDRVGYDGGPWFSPDGTKIVWRAWYPETKQEKAMWKDAMEHDYIIAVPLDIWVMDADGSNKRRLTNNGATNWAPSWHPDGKQIIFSSNMDDWREDIKTFGHNFELYMIKSDGTALERITYNKVFDSFPMFSPDGRKLVFASNRNSQKPRETDIFIADFDVISIYPQNILDASAQRSAAAAFSPERMMETVKFLASDELKGRGPGMAELDSAAEYIAEKFKQAGLEPAGDKEGGYFQSWEDAELKIKMKNIIGVIPGKKQEWSGQSVVIGAHYDHLGLGISGGLKENIGKVHPGADDNASGVAVMIELARVLSKSLNPDRSVVFAAFTGEEAGKRGSKYYVINEKQYPVSKCIGMLNLDTVGRLGKKKLLVLGAGSAKEWTHIFKGAGSASGIEVEIVSEELDSSDQKSFQEAGVPAVQLFSGPHPDYHRPTDTVEKIDPDGLMKIVSVAKEVVEYVVNRAEPLTFAGKPEAAPESGPKKERKVSLGAIPDFAYSGKGVRLSGVVPGSPAEASGLKAGDVVIKINSHDIGSLKDFSNVLKTLNPGDRASITFLREGREVNVDAVVKEK